MKARVKENISYAYGTDPELIAGDKYDACAVIRFSKGDFWNIVERQNPDPEIGLPQIEFDNVLVEKGEVKILLTHKLFAELFEEVKDET